jgi:hypothetical protein
LLNALSVESTAYSSLDKSQLLAKVHSAITSVYRHDHDLLDLDVNERAIAHRLAVYLEPIFAGWNIDCEYNRYGEELAPKTLPGIKICKHSKVPTDSIVPDILIHERKSKDKNNLVALEIKSNGSLTKCDHLKLQGLTSQDEKYQYNYGIGIEFYPDKYSMLVYIGGDGVEGPTIFDGRLLDD